MPVIVLNKSIGQTPKELVEEYKKNNNIKKISYCGRLDPMAHGIILALTNDDCKFQDYYLTLDKVYEFDIVFGISTDSHDPLSKNITISDNDFDLEQLEKLIVNKYTGKISQKYPLCSSYTVDVGVGRKIPLWYAFKNNLLPHNFVLPSKTVDIKSFKIINHKLVEDSKLFDDFIVDLKKVNDLGESFGKQTAITFYNSNKNNKKYNVCSCEVKCSSGTYIRSLVRDISKDLNKYAIAHRIKRTEMVF